MAEADPDILTEYVKALIDPANHMCAVPDGVQQPHKMKRIFINAQIKFTTGSGSIVFYPGAHEHRVGTYIEYVDDDTQEATVRQQITSTENLGTNYDMIKLAAGQIRCEASTQATTTAVLAGNACAAIANAPIVEINPTVDDGVEELPASAIGYSALPSITQNAYEVMPRASVVDTIVFNILPRTIGMPPIRDNDPIPYKNSANAVTSSSYQTGTQNSVVAHLAWTSTSGVDFVDDIYVESPKYNVTTNSGRLHSILSINVKSIPEVSILASPEWTSGDRLGFKVKAVARWYGLDNKIGGNIIKEIGQIDFNSEGGLAPYYNPQACPVNVLTTTVDFDYDVNATITKIDFRYELVPFIRQSAGAYVDLPMTGEFSMDGPFIVDFSWEVTMPSRNYPGFDDQNLILSVSKAVPGTVYSISGELVYMATPNTNLLKQVSTTMSGATFSEYLSVQKLIRMMVDGYGWRLVGLKDQMRPLDMFTAFRGGLPHPKSHDAIYGSASPFLNRLKHLSSQAVKPFETVKKEVKQFVLPIIKKKGVEFAKEYVNKLIEEAPEMLAPAVASGGIASGGLAAPSLSASVLKSLKDVPNLLNSLRTYKSLGKKFLRVLNKYYPIIKTDPDVVAILKDPTIRAIINELKGQLPMLMSTGLKQKQVDKGDTKFLNNDLHLNDVIVVEYDGMSCLVPYIVEDLLSELTGEVDTSGVTYLTGDRRLMHPFENECKVYGMKEPKDGKSQALNVKPKMPMKLFTLLKVEYSKDMKKTWCYLRPCRRIISGRSIEAGIAMLNSALTSQRTLSLCAVSGAVDHSQGDMRIMPLPANVARPKQAAIDALAKGLPVVVLMNSNLYLPPGQIVFEKVTTVKEAVDHVTVFKRKEKKSIYYSCDGKWCKNNMAGKNGFVMLGSPATEDSTRVLLATAPDQVSVSLSEDVEDSKYTKAVIIDLGGDEPVFPGEVSLFPKKYNAEALRIYNSKKYLDHPKVLSTFSPAKFGVASCSTGLTALDELCGSIGGELITDVSGGVWIPDGNGEVARMATDVDKFNEFDKAADYTLAKIAYQNDKEFNLASWYKHYQLKTISIMFPVVAGNLEKELPQNSVPGFQTQGDGDKLNVFDKIDRAYDNLNIKLPESKLYHRFVFFGNAAAKGIAGYDGKYLTDSTFVPVWLGRVMVGFQCRPANEDKDGAESVKLREWKAKLGLSDRRGRFIRKGADRQLLPEVFSEKAIADAGEYRKAMIGSPSGPTKTSSQNKTQRQGRSQMPGQSKTPKTAPKSKAKNPPELVYNGSKYVLSSG